MVQFIASCFFFPDCNGSSTDDVIIVRLAGGTWMVAAAAIVVVVGICMVFACDGRTMVEGMDDGQTNGINFIPFVCPSRTPIRGERARARGVVDR